MKWPLLCQLLLLHRTFPDTEHIILREPILTKQIWVLPPSWLKVWNLLTWIGVGCLEDNEQFNYLWHCRVRATEGGLTADCFVEIVTMNDYNGMQRHCVCPFRGMQCHWQTSRLLSSQTTESGWECTDYNRLETIIYKISQQCWDFDIL